MTAPTFRGNMRSANKLLLTEQQSKNSWERDSIRIRSKSMEYTSEQYQSRRNNLRAALKTHIFKAYVYIF